MFSHNGANTDTGHRRITHRDSPGGAGGEVCCRRLPCWITDQSRRRAARRYGRAQVRGYIYDVVPAGGYQLYGCLGSSLSQARPLHVALYGLPHEQSRFTPASSLSVSSCSVVQ